MAHPQYMEEVLRAVQDGKQALEGHREAMKQAASCQTMEDLASFSTMTRCGSCSAWMSQGQTFFSRGRNDKCKRCTDAFERLVPDCHIGDRSPLLKLHAFVRRLRRDMIVHDVQPGALLDGSAYAHDTPHRQALMHDAMYFQPDPDPCTTAIPLPEAFIAEAAARWKSMHAAEVKRNEVRRMENEQVARMHAEERVDAQQWDEAVNRMEADWVFNTVASKAYLAKRLLKEAFDDHMQLCASLSSREFEKLRSLNEQRLERLDAT